MRNLKKILALVLALMMTVSVMVTAGASSYTDGDQVSDAYAEAVEVLSGMGVFRGQSDNQFAPKATITRAEVAAIVYRILTADVKDAQTGIYADYNKFEDVPSNVWYAGYVNYAANGNYIMGDGQGHFYPMTKVNGYQVLAIMLRAIGYGQNGEFEGAGWEIRTATKAKELGITNGITDTTLGQAATRELVAELLFRAILVTKVDYTPAFGYTTYGNNSIGKDNFNLVQSARKSVDEWGRPGYEWTYTTGNKATVITETPVATYTTAVTECDIAAAVGFSGTKTYDTFVNGAVNASKYAVQATDVVTKIGAQGRLTEVYADRIVMVDTMLAEVTNVTVAKFDAAGHLYQQAALTLKVFDANNNSTTVTLYSTTNWTYTVGQMLLVNAVTDSAAVTGTHSSVSVNSTRKYVEVVGVAQSFVGAQTVIHYNDGKHTVNGTDYLDANCFHLDQAGKDTANHNWFLDQYGNLIGVTDIESLYTYGTIKNLQWINPVGTAGYAQATIVYMDGSEQVKTVATLNGIGMTYVTTGTNPGAVVNGKYAISTSLTENDAFCAQASGLYRISENSNGTLSLQWVNDTVVGGGRLANSTISTTVSAITGTAVSPSTSNSVYTDSATQYLVRTGTTGKYVYTPVTGLNNVANYNASTVDYIDVNKDGRVDYVFFFGNAVDSQYDGLFYLTTTSYQEYLMADGKTVDFYVLTGYVNGELGTIKIDASNAALVTRIISGGVNKLWEIHFTGDFVTSIVNDITAVATTPVDTNGVYANLNAVYCNATSGSKATFANDVLLFNGNAYNVTTATRVYGELSAVMDNHNIYVVYDSNNYAKEIYVSDKAYTPGTPAADKATFIYSVTMEYKTGYVTTRTASVEVNDGTYIGVGTQSFANVATSYWPDIQQSNWTLLTDTSVGQAAFNAVGGNVYTYSYYIQAN